MKKVLKRILDFITNKDVVPNDITYYYHINEEHLKNGQIEVMENDNDIIEEVFEYNARVAKNRVVLMEIADAKKGYFRVNLLFIFLSLVVMFIYEASDKEGFNLYYGYLAIVIFTAVYIYLRLSKKYNIYVNVLPAILLVVVDNIFVIAVIANIILGYLYDRATKKVKEDFGYPNFPSIDMILHRENGQTMKIFAREML